MAPGLERYGRAKDLIKELIYETKELEEFMRASKEDYGRLKIRMKYLLKQKIPEPEPKKSNKYGNTMLTPLRSNSAVSVS